MKYTIDPWKHQAGWTLLLKMITASKGFRLHPDDAQCRQLHGSLVNAHCAIVLVYRCHAIWHWFKQVARDLPFVWPRF